MTPNPLRWTPQMRKLYGKPPYQPDDTDGFNVKLKAYAEAMRRIAKTEQLPLIDVYQAFEEFGARDGQTVDDLLLDGIHPNERGQRIVADHLLAVLLKIGKPNTQSSAHPIDVKIVDNPAASSAFSLAFLARSEAASSFLATLRSLIPVREVIHSSLVSRNSSKSEFFNIFSGT